MNDSNLEVAAPPSNRLHPALSWLWRRRLMVGGIAVAAVGLALGWNWLAAASVLPILLCTVPCAIMMGMCMKGKHSGKSSKSCADDEQAAKAADPEPPSALAPLPPSSSKRIED